VGILAHVDAGKTSLTERLLYEAGAIDRLGSVDAGTSRTDSMDIERRRGITVRTDVASFDLSAADGFRSVNQIDTPGHSDFIAEVERSLTVLDAAVLVISAVEGVQPQTVVLWRAMRRLRLPVAIFVNKIDRAGADPRRVVDEVRARLAEPAEVGLVVLSRADRVGADDVRVAEVDETAAANLDVIADHDLRVLADLVDHGHTDELRARDSARSLWSRGEVVPLLMGSALTGAGVPELKRLIARFPTIGPADGPLSAVVFKIDNADDGRTVWARVFAGTLRVRDRLAPSGSKPERVTGLTRASSRGPRPVESVGRGDVVQIRGLRTARIGDWLGEPQPDRVRHRFAEPTLESVVDPVHPEQRGRMYDSLATLAEQDPLINLRIDDDRGEIAVSLYGEVQKEVIATLLQDQFGVAVTFRETTTVQIERVIGTGTAEAVGLEDGNPYFATLGFRVEPAPIGTGVQVDLEVELGSMPAAFFAATREGIATGLAQGLHGWQLPDARVVITRTGYWPRQSHMHQKFNKGMSSVAADFRNLSPVLIHRALHLAGSRVCEPVDTFGVETTTDTMDAVVSLMARLEGTITNTRPGHDRIMITGTLPARQVRSLATALPDPTRGEAVLSVEHDHYRPVSGTPPERPRVGPDPLDFELWVKARPR
jgi:ribosomal protection tetracycline resistance protein